MDLYITNTKFELVGVIDSYTSLIWTERYNNCGDFEIMISANDKNIDILQNGYYIKRPASDRVGIIETKTTQTNEETGDYIIVSGRMLESILDRRIVWQQTTLNSSINESVHRLLIENAISPGIKARTIPNLTFITQEEFEGKVEMQVTGDSLLTVILDICKMFGLGFKVTLSTTNVITACLYKGADRSYQQNENSYVEFSPDFDNLISSNFMTSSQNYRNVALVAGEGEGLDRKTIPVGAAEGMERYELYVDARDVSSNEGEITEQEYLTLLRERGKEKLLEYLTETYFEADIEPRFMFQYRKDYMLGDIIILKNEYGITAYPRIIEVIESEDETGYKVVPTFESEEGKF